MFQLKGFGQWDDVELPFANLAAFNAPGNRADRNAFLTGFLLSNWGRTVALCRKLRSSYYFGSSRVTPAHYLVDPVTDEVFTARLCYSYAENRGRGMKHEHDGVIEVKLMDAAPEKT